MTQTASGLFRATRKARKVRAQLNLDGEIEKSDVRLRQKDDFEPTPPEPTRALLRAEAEPLSRFPVIWEPAFGAGHMAREFTAAGFDWIGTDLVDRGAGAHEIRDFFDYDQPLSPCIVTNPPYNKVNFRDGKGAWIEHAMGTLGVEYMALLLSWNWPGAGGLAGLWERYKPARVYLTRWKIDFSGEGAPPMLNGWFVWERGFDGPAPYLLMLDRDGDARQGDLL